MEDEELETVSSCPSCKSLSVELDVEKGTRICHSCGLVLEENIVRPEIEFELQNPVGQLVAHSEYRILHGSDWQLSGIRGEIAKHNILDAKKKPYSVLQKLCVLFNMMGYLDQAKHIFIQVAKHPPWSSGRNQVLLAAACFYVMLRQNEKAGSIEEIARIMSCSKAKMGRIYLQARRFAQVPVVVHLPEVHLERIISKLNYQNVDNLLLHKTAEKIISLARDYTLTSGRIPEVVAAAAVVLSCLHHGIHMEPSEILRTTSSLNSISESTLSSYYNDMINMLINVAKSIPWCSDVSKENVILHMSDIFEFGKILHDAKIEDSNAPLINRREKQLNSLKHTFKAQSHPKAKVENTKYYREIEMLKKLLLKGVPKCDLLKAKYSDLRLMIKKMDIHTNAPSNIRMDDDVNTYIRSAEEIEEVTPIYDQLLKDTK